MIETTTETKYHLRCDRCGGDGPKRRAASPAIAAAKADGWVVNEAWNGLAYHQEHICPWCLKSTSLSAEGPAGEE